MYIYHIYMNIYIYIHIYIQIRSATVPLGTPGRVRGLCLLSAVFCLIFLLLREQTDMFRILLASLVLHTFFIIFSSLIFCENWCQKVSKWAPQNTPKSQKSTKPRHQTAPAIKACKKSLSGRGQISEIDDPYTLLTLFSEGQGSQK